MGKDIVLVLVLLLCLAMVVYPAVLMARQLHRRAKWVSVEAKVVGTQSKKSQNNSPGGGTHDNRTYHARYSFTTADGRRQEGKSETRELHKFGDMIKIQYDPADPSRSQAGFPGTMFWVLSTFSVVLFAFIAVLTVAGLTD